MDQWNRPTLRDLFKKEEIVVVRREQRRIYKLNWKVFFRNLYNLIAFWKPENKRLHYRRSVVLSAETKKDEIGAIREPVIKDSICGHNNMQE